MVNQQNKKTIYVVCKSKPDDKFRLLYEFWSRQLDKEDLTQIPKDLIVKSMSVSEEETLQNNQCRWFYCPVYHCCPFDTEVAPGILGRSNKKKIDVKFEGLNTTTTNIDKIKPTTLEKFGLRDGVTDEVIRGDDGTL